MIQGETARDASGTRPERVRFFKFYCVGRVRDASGTRPQPFLPGGYFDPWIIPGTKVCTFQTGAISHPDGVPTGLNTDFGGQMTTFCVRTAPVGPGAQCICLMAALAPKMNFCEDSTVAWISFAFGTEAAVSGSKPEEQFQKVESPQKSIFGDEELSHSAATLRIPAEPSSPSINHHQAFKVYGEHYHHHDDDVTPGGVWGTSPVPVVLTSFMFAVLTIPPPQLSFPGSAAVTLTTTQITAAQVPEQEHCGRVRLELDPVDGENRYKGRCLERTPNFGFATLLLPRCVSDCFVEYGGRGIGIAHPLRAIRLLHSEPHLCRNAHWFRFSDPVGRVEGGRGEAGITTKPFRHPIFWGATRELSTPAGAHQLYRERGPGPGTGHPPKSSSPNGPVRPPLMCCHDLVTYFVASKWMSFEPIGTDGSGQQRF
eukprot:gene24421-biopygen2910